MIPDVAGASNPASCEPRMRGDDPAPKILLIHDAA